MHWWLRGTMQRWQLCRKNPLRRPHVLRDVIFEDILTRVWRDAEWLLPSVLVSQQALSSQEGNVCFSTQQLLFFPINKNMTPNTI